MAPSKYESSDDESSSGESSSAAQPSPPQIARRKHFEDEEDESDVLESWDAAEDSEEEAEKAKKAAEAKAKVEAEAAKNKKSKAQRIEEQREARRRARDGIDEDESSEDEDEAQKRARLRMTEQAADLKHAEDLFANIGIKDRKSTQTVVSADPADPTKSINLGALALFNPSTKDQFLQLRQVLVPLITANSKKAQYGLFMQEFSKQIVKDLPSEQIKKISSGLATLSNEKMKEEKAAEKGGKKTKAAKTKATLSANRHISSTADTNAYADELDDGDFM